AAQNAPTATQSGATGTGSSSWYFYNVQLRTKGYSDFVKKWGKRKQEDNWRRKDKTNSSDFSTENVLANTSQHVESEEDITELEEKALENLPLTVEKITQSNDKVIDAYYASGTIYKDDLENYRKARQQFEELLRRFPKSRLEAETY